MLYVRTALQSLVLNCRRNMNRHCMWMRCPHLITPRHWHPKWKLVNRSWFISISIILTKVLTDIFRADWSDTRVTNISRSFTHNMAAKTSRHTYGTKLRHCHPMYINLLTYLRSICWRCAQKTYSKPAEMIPSQSFGSSCGGGGGGGAENGRRPGEGRAGAGGSIEKVASSWSDERAMMRVSHIDVTMLNSSPTASCKSIRSQPHLLSWKLYNAV